MLATPENKGVLQTEKNECMSKWHKRQVRRVLHGQRLGQFEQ